MSASNQGQDAKFIANRRFTGVINILPSSRPQYGWENRVGWIWRSTPLFDRSRR
ncbi:hypothetical protein [Acaryochloris sp. IP29b_bin.137]|uniref:hypothetical protein n=1 Tax=Acaryochloris sp. IP29b_bin.137 TaxID=2969217 RepID=UPI00263A363A|nr:hypothetical protein [Acaryochloris sp. IP29b_bin.137]